MCCADTGAPFYFLHAIMLLLICFRPFLSPAVRLVQMQLHRPTLHMSFTAANTSCRRRVGNVV